MVGLVCANLGLLLQTLLHIEKIKAYKSYLTLMKMREAFWFEILVNHQLLGNNKRMTSCRGTEQTQKSQNYS